MQTPRSLSHRSSSGVRDLRAMFERKDSFGSNTNSPDRGRSPSGSSVSRIASNEKLGEQTRKIRSTFISVENMSSTADERRDSVSLATEQGQDQAARIKADISQEAAYTPVPESALSPTAESKSLPFREDVIATIVL